MKVKIKYHSQNIQFKRIESITVPRDGYVITWNHFHVFGICNDSFFFKTQVLYMLQDNNIYKLNLYLN